MVLFGALAKRAKTGLAGLAFSLTAIPVALVCAGVPTFPYSASLGLLVAFNDRLAGVVSLAPRLGLLASRECPFHGTRFARGRPPRRNAVALRDGSLYTEFSNSGLAQPLEVPPCQLSVPHGLCDHLLFKNRGHLFIISVEIKGHTE